MATKEKIFRIKVKDRTSYLRAISGVFRTGDNPHGITNKEIEVLSVILYVMGIEEVSHVTSSVREQVAVLSGMSRQMVGNYLSKFREKQLFTQDNKPHSLLIGSGLNIQKL